MVAPKRTFFSATELYSGFWLITSALPVEREFYGISHSAEFQLKYTCSYQ